MDAVEYFVTQWRTERPELDVSPMEVIGRLSRLAGLVQGRLDTVFGEHGLQSWEFDVMATLRRSGAPYELTPGQLDRAMMITSGTTTHRISKLALRGFVTRSKDPDDGRVVRVRLTEDGMRVFDECHRAHLDNEARILAAMDDDAVVHLREGLTALSASLGDRAPVEGR